MNSGHGRYARRPGHEAAETMSFSDDTIADLVKRACAALRDAQKRRESAEDECTVCVAEAWRDAGVNVQLFQPYPNTGDQNDLELHDADGALIAVLEAKRFADARVRDDARKMLRHFPDASPRKFQLLYGGHFERQPKWTDWFDHLRSRYDVKLRYRDTWFSSFLVASPTPGDRYGAFFDVVVAETLPASSPRLTRAVESC